jgi:hypothetical protein
MSNIGIETVGPEPQAFEPNPGHSVTYDTARDEAWGMIRSRPQSGEKATASAILALAAQIARIADAIEFAIKEGV